MWFFSAEAARAELERELQAHLELEAEEQQEAGMSAGKKRAMPPSGPLAIKA